MATPKTRVTRNGNGNDDGQDHLDLGGDVALVGDPGDGANILAEDREDANWDEPDDKKGDDQRPKGRTEDVEPEFDEEDSRLAYTDTGEQDEDTPRGNARRARRNARRRQAQQAAQRENDELRQQVERLTGVVTQLASGQQGLAVNTLDAQVSTLQGQLRVVDDEMANAIKNSDGDTYQRAQRLRDEIVGRLYAAKTHRDRMATDQQDGSAHLNGGGPVNGPQRQQQQQQQQRGPDPRVMQYFDRFCDRYDWFDPESSDANANIVRALDQELVADGYQRHTPVFWRQLERRLSEDYGLTPNGQSRNGGDDEHEDERPGRESVTQQQRRRPPTNGGRSTTSGRAAGFRLTDIQTNILREEGLLEENLSDADKAKRQRIVDKWKRGATADRRGAQQ